MKLRPVDPGRDGGIRVRGGYCLRIEDGVVVIQIEQQELIDALFNDGFSFGKQNKDHLPTIREGEYRLEVVCRAVIETEDTTRVMA